MINMSVLLSFPLQFQVFKISCCQAGGSVHCIPTLKKKRVVLSLDIKTGDADGN